MKQVLTIGILGLLGGLALAYVVLTYQASLQRDGSLSRSALPAAIAG
ncbi:hypothetical protein [Donghicola tyrosinivorans]|uniref:Uncharacterized protein n=1 Tax=Donghicola tyrosinivorans TaxID=1652492 RepID=A0A2T0X0C2_9RHOB|nr:hypothetical protein [Donghicola tyrosinivorans]PRY92396.1 hypothetical protein CLV74_102311 [Donghicola tyrosinivorans]